MAAQSPAGTFRSGPLLLESSVLFTDLYQLVIGEVEKPLFKAVLRYTNGNQSEAAEILGINRGTLRKKLKQYGL